jgi:ornithine decarboxylase
MGHSFAAGKIANTGMGGAVAQHRRHGKTPRAAGWFWRYLPLEIVGLLAAVGAGLATYATTGNAVTTAFAASIGESIGFYSAALVAEFVRTRSLRVSVRNLVVEFGVAEVADTLLVRPAAIYALQSVSGNVTVGVVLGKLAADVAFYAMAIPALELRRRWRPDAVEVVTPSLPQTKRPPTPFLVMDLDIVTKRYEALCAALPGTDIHYAMKCNPHSSVLEHLARLGCKFEVASITELMALQDCGVDPADVVFSHPMKRSADIADAWKAGVWRFAADSASEIEKIARIAPGAGVIIRMAAPGIHSEVASEGKFGVGVPGTIALLHMARHFGLDTYGLAFHVGSQMLEPLAWEPAIAAACRVMDVVRDDGIVLSALDVGGGFPVHYDDEIVPPIAEYGSIIRKALDTHLPHEVDLLAEPGRALVAEAGTIVSTVIGVAERFGKRWVHLDVGAFNGMMEALESANQLHFPVSDSLHSPLRVPYNVTGPSCDSQDTILFDALLSAGLQEGDKVYLHCAGAYTTSYASRFNGFDVPRTRVRKRQDSNKTENVGPRRHG